MARVLAVCGMPASGKGLFAEILAKKGVPVRSMGDMIRAEVNRLGLEESPSIFGEIATRLRAEYGDDVLAHRLIDEVDSLLEYNPVVLIEGMRGTAEKSVFESHWGDLFSTVAISAHQDIRFARISKRQRSEDGNRDDLEDRDRREIGWGLEILLSEAEFKFRNEADIDAFRIEVETWFNSL